MQTFDTAIFDGNQDPPTQGDFIFDTEFVILTVGNAVIAFIPDRVTEIEASLVE